MTRYVDNRYTMQYRATVGADFMAKDVMIDDKMVSLQVSPVHLGSHGCQDLGYGWIGEVHLSGRCILQRGRLLCPRLRYHLSKSLAWDFQPDPDRASSR